MNQVTNLTTEIQGVAPNNLSMLTNIIFSKELRRLQDKTQMFNTEISEHYRTRLTHTVEVAAIAQRIAEEINKIIDADSQLDINLIKAISYAHDLGHTPYGHAGEQTINSLLVKEGLLFKHNVNSAKILLDPKITKINNTVFHKL